VPAEEVEIHTEKAIATGPFATSTHGGKNIQILDRSPKFSVARISGKNMGS